MAFAISTLIVATYGNANTTDGNSSSGASLHHKAMNHSDSEMIHGESQQSDMKHTEMMHGKMAHHEMQHHGKHKHTPIDASDWPALPSLTLTAYKDSVSGWNLHIAQKNFQFAPRHVNTENKQGEGHGHLYINGEKVTRLYGDWYYINALPIGTHTVTVSLHANDHSPLTVNGNKVSANLELVQN